MGSRRSRTDAAPLQNNKATNMNKKTIITILFALVAMAWPAIRMRRIC